MASNTESSSLPVHDAPLAEGRTRFSAALNAEQIKLAYAQLPAGLLASLVNAPLVSIALWGETPSFRIVAWLAAVGVLTVWRYLTLLQYRSNAADAAGAETWGRRFRLGAALSGISWGAAGFWLFPAHSDAHQMLLGFVLGGMVAGGIATLSSLPRAYLLFMLPAIAPFLVRMLAFGGQSHVFMGLMVVVFAAIMWVASGRVHAMIKESLLVRFENLELVTDLHLAKTCLEGTNRQLQGEERALKELNETLSQRIADELAKNREKDHLLIQQSRQAAMGEMVNNIAHQWRQPLNALGLVLANIQDVLDSDVRDKQDQERLMQHGHRLIAKMSSTIDDFRRFFHPNREKTCFSLIKAVEDAVALVQPSFNHQNIEICCEEMQDVSANGYPNEFSQALLNLLNNAKDAIQQKQAANGRVAIRVHSAAGRCLVEVSDNGGGIAEDILPKIFDPYFTTKDSGTGIGLYMSKMVMKNMGGDIEVKNGSEGAVFTLEIPAIAAEKPT